MADEKLHTQLSHRLFATNRSEMGIEMKNVLIETDCVTKKFRRKQVLNGVSLKLEKGVYGMLGPNGAGKTTLIRCMLGLYPVSGGEIRREVPLHRIGYLPQQFGMFRELSVYDMLSYFAGLKKVSDREREIDAALAYVNLADNKKTRISKLSGGMQRRVGVAQAILGEPALVIFDEPTAGLDPEERRRFKDMLAELKEHSAILFSTHIVEDIEDVCDRIIIMNHGEIIRTGTMEEICGAQTLERAYLDIIEKSREGDEGR